MSTPDTGDLTSLVRQLVDSWDAAPMPFRFSGAGQPAQFASLYGLAAHAHRVADATLLLIGQDLTLEALPLVRSTYECALTATWLLRVEDATVGFVREGGRQRTRLLKEAQIELPKNDFAHAEQIASEFDHHPGTAEQSARVIKERCDDLTPGGSSAYLHYRAMSALSHAGPFIADYYLDLADGQPLPTLRRTPKHENPDTWLFLTAAALVWAGRAVSVCNADHQRRSELRQAARTLAVPLDLLASDRVVVRQARARQERNAARRRP